MRVALLVVCGLVATANADNRTSKVLLGGLTVAYVSHGDDVSAGEVGAEGSIAFLNKSRTDGALSRGPYTWGGFYADVIRDFAIDETRFSIGPEFGSALLGGDAGFVYQTGGRFGFVVRPVLTIGVVTLFYRYGRYLDDDPGNGFHEVGIIGKLYKKL